MDVGNSSAPPTADINGEWGSQLQRAALQRRGNLKINKLKQRRRGTRRRDGPLRDRSNALRSTTSVIDDEDMTTWQDPVDEFTDRNRNAEILQCNAEQSTYSKQTADMMIASAKENVLNEQVTSLKMQANARRKARRKTKVIIEREMDDIVSTFSVVSVNVTATDSQNSCSDGMNLSADQSVITAMTSATAATSKSHASAATSATDLSAATGVSNVSATTTRTSTTKATNASDASASTSASYATGISTMTGVTGVTGITTMTTATNGTRGTTATYRTYSTNRSTATKSTMKVHRQGIFSCADWADYRDIWEESELCWNEAIGAQSIDPVVWKVDDDDASSDGSVYQLQNRKGKTGRASAASPTRETRGRSRIRRTESTNGSTRQASSHAGDEELCSSAGPSKPSPARSRDGPGHRKCHSTGGRAMEPVSFGRNTSNIRIEAEVEDEIGNIEMNIVYVSDGSESDDESHSDERLDPVTDVSAISSEHDPAFDDVIVKADISDLIELQLEDAQTKTNTSTATSSGLRQSVLDRDGDRSHASSFNDVVQTSREELRQQNASFLRSLEAEAANCDHSSTESRTTGNIIDPEIYLVPKNMDNSFGMLNDSRDRPETTELIHLSDGAQEKEDQEKTDDVHIRTQDLDKVDRDEMPFDCHLDHPSQEIVAEETTRINGNKHSRVSANMAERDIEDGVQLEGNASCAPAACDDTSARPDINRLCEKYTDEQEPEPDIDEAWLTFSEKNEDHGALSNNCSIDDSTTKHHVSSAEVMTDPVVAATSAAAPAPIEEHTNKPSMNAVERTSTLSQAMDSPTEGPSALNAVSHDRDENSTPRKQEKAPDNKKPSQDAPRQDPSPNSRNRRLAHRQNRRKRIADLRRLHRSSTSQPKVVAK